MVVGFAIIAGCATEDRRDSEHLGQLESECSSNCTNSLATEWATIAADAILRPVEESPALRTPGQSVTLHAMVALAVYDTAVAFQHRHDPFSIDVDAGNADQNAAMTTAAYRVLRTRVPGRGAFLDGRYATSMATIPDGAAKDAGIALGEQVAQHYIALRANDNLDATVPYVQPPPGPGVFEPVVAATPVDVKLQIVPGYTITNEEKQSFFPRGPASLTSNRYTRDWTEVRDYGRSDSTVRTAAQKDVALFWSEQTYRHWARNVIKIATDKGLNCMGAARFLAMTLTASADAVTTGFTSKYHFMFWRPFHSVPRAETDGNPATPGDTTWTPLLNINHPEYPSAHSFWSWALVDAARSFFGRDHVTVTLQTVGVVGLVQPERTYTKLSDIGEEVEDARVWAGIHYRFSVDDGRKLGKDTSKRTLRAFRH